MLIPSLCPIFKPTIAKDLMLGPVPMFNHLSCPLPGCWGWRNGKKQWSQDGLIISEPLKLGKSFKKCLNPLLLCAVPDCTQEFDPIEMENFVEISDPGPPIHEKIFFFSIYRNIYRIVQQQHKNRYNVVC